jgi:acetyl esterase/lipase
MVMRGFSPEAAVEAGMKRRIPTMRARSQITHTSVAVLAALISMLLVNVASAPAASAIGVGGVNTGQPGSTCAPSDGGLAYTAPGAGISTTALGPAPAYYELGQPTGAFAGQPAKGLMITIHGGGWYVVGPGAVVVERPAADLWRSRGWETLNITYRACAQSLTDVMWFHDAARRLVGTALPLCATGGSAGGHLALMMASLRSDVGCVIAEAAPADLVILPTQLAYNPVSAKLDQTAGPRWTYNLAVAAFGVTQLAAMSPALHPGSTRLLLATAQRDEFVPWAQAQEMASAAKASNPHNYVDVQQLQPGTLSYTHLTPTKGTGVSTSANNEYLVHQLKSVAPLVGATGTSSEVINDIRVPSMGGYRVGDEEFDASALATQTNIRVSGRVGLAPGRTFKLMTCAAYYDPMRAAQSSCNDAIVDTRSSTGVVATPIPGVSASWARPNAGTGNGFAYGIVWVWYLDAGNHWVFVASSAPDRATDAGASIPPVGS